MTATSLQARPDEILAAAVELARTAAQAEAAPAPVGVYRGAQAGPDDSPGAPVAIHLFDCTTTSYSGWCWSVALTRLVDDDRVTIDEVVLQPGEGALLPPPWVPWRERLRPGDLGVGDLLPAEADDSRLVPSYTLTGDPAVDEVAFELGIGRVRVMSRPGRRDAAERWHEGDTGPDAPRAKQAPGRCGTCGFFLSLEGSLRAVVGACGNEFAPSDGRVVTVDFGCGAHSEAVPEPEEAPRAVSYDTASFDTEDVEVTDVADHSAAEPAAEPS